ncbi:heparan-alpha-glucosaminide N-acetyltransferase domain-containing protein [Methanoregula sp.]|uniref:heparan-alpha-glucosaminide N-acetyltransferase domain-containing protein n=1 Tax=Methanoregula sp. TaxID=2052170 RepID=UPI00356B42EF
MENACPDAAPKRGSFRDIPIDILRGLAIVLMILANLVPALFMPPVPGWFRFLCSLAAPLFIVTAGMMVALSRTGKGRSFGYIALRGGLVILVAALLQVLVFKYIPFIDMDVLYLIGISLPLAYLYLGLPERKRWIVIVAILLMAPVLWAGLGYNTAVIDPTFSLFSPAVPGTPVPGPLDIVKSWFVDGWFPIFPWAALALFGAEVGMYRWGKGEVRSFRFNCEGLYATGLLIGGGILWVLFPGAQALRDGYVELFYPPVIGLLLFSAGVFLLALTVLDHLPGYYSLLDPLRVTGECSLAIYLIHYTIIQKVIAPLQIRLPLLQYLEVYFVLLIGMILLAYLLRWVRKTWRNQPFLVRFLIGG